MPSTLTESRPPQEGRDHTYTVDPPPGPNCEVQWFIDGQSAGMHGRIGGLRVSGFSHGTMSVTVEDGAAAGSTRISVRVDCPGQPPRVVEGMPVGAGSFSGNGSAPAPQPAHTPQPDNDELDAVTFRGVHWPWWRRLLGFCPEEWYEENGTRSECTREELTSGIPIVYHTVTCTYRRPDGSTFTLTWTALFGVLVDGPS
jgi:hypothetical protein